MSVGELQSKCYDCVSRADSMTPEYYLSRVLDELQSDLDRALESTVVRL